MTYYPTLAICYAGVSYYQPTSTSYILDLSAYRRPSLSSRPVQDKADVFTTEVHETHMRIENQFQETKAYLQVHGTDLQLLEAKLEDIQDKHSK